ncbi:MAG: hypothetical protein JJU29_01780 [Verrucomicrobia bacterium]|nr:hypothetical protein [Verrucomicrobiota bacterium]MCH8510963.1 hypothetical protein [Kiritimatiellia bacterium]
MAISFGLLSVVLGFILIIIGIVRLAASRPYAVKMLLAAVLLIGTGILLLHLGEGTGFAKVPIGITLLLVGIVLILFGSWSSFWGPLASRNARFGSKFIFYGLVAITIGILIIALPWASPSYGGRSSHWQRGGSDWNYIMSRRMGPIPFGAFTAGALLFANGLGIKNGLTASKLLGANLTILALLIIIYFMGPTLFSHW